MNAIERIISIFTPFECLNCGQEGRLICESCYPLVCIPLPSRCYKCRVSTDDWKVCSNCRRKSPLRHVIVRTEFSGLAKQLLYAYKFERAQAGAESVANFMSQMLKGPTNFLLMPVPTATSRIRQRGYDQASLLAKELAVIWESPYLQGLARLNQSRQVGTKRADRMVQLQGAYRIRYPDFIKDAHVMLIDDVVTSGATLEAAATELRLAGAKRVDALVFAQK